MAKISGSSSLNLNDNSIYTGSGVGVGGFTYGTNTARASACEYQGHVLTKRELVYQADARSAVSFICSECSARIWVDTDILLDVYEADHSIAGVMNRAEPDDLDELLRLETLLTGHAAQIADTLALLSTTRQSLTKKLLR